MRSDDALMLDMLLAARKIRQFMTGVTLADFKTNQMVQSAVIRELQVIGEAARMISTEKKANLPGINWQAATGMRNRLVHEYFAVNLDIVWITVKTDVEPLLVQLKQQVPPDHGVTE